MYRFLLTASLLALTACGTPDGSGDDEIIADPGPAECDETGTEVGQCAQDFTLKTADDVDFTLADTAGQRVVLVGAAEW